MKKYGMIGSANVTVCPEHLRPDDAIEVLSDNPNPDLYVLSHDGSWILSVDYAKAREATIIAEWPVHQQLEALVEFLDGKPAKLDKLRAYIEEVRVKFPK